MTARLKTLESNITTRLKALDSGKEFNRYLKINSFD
jgi:hypothetical protein